jgi:hypothetical protein
MPQPSTLRLILNAAGLVAASPTLLLSDQAPAPGLIPQIAPNLHHIAAPLACACRHSMLRAHSTWRMEILV